ncbi:hypothetical protein PR003_g28233 [Phytophthora rubi]|uniref:Uncharacterized protein n=1 Tax=Phytophthora rubi TaxID=129364 RepID=A0A6A4BU52_9STRA|nr:hypothetical protein PR003_g28233 [Phytophthora rubi]
MDGCCGAAVSLLVAGPPMCCSRVTTFAALFIDFLVSFVASASWRGLPTMIENAQ